MNALWWVQHVSLTAISSIALGIGMFFCNNLTENEHFERTPAPTSLNLLAIGLFYGGTAVFIWQGGLSCYDGIENGLGPLTTWPAVGMFWAATFTTIILIVVAVYMSMEYRYRRDVKKCLENGGHHFKYVPAYLSGVYHSHFCEVCGAPRT